MIVVIEGRRGEGKSTLASEIVKGEIVSNMEESELDALFLGDKIKDGTTWIVLEDVKSVEWVKAQFKGDKLAFSKRGHGDAVMNMPNILIIKRS